MSRRTWAVIDLGALRHNLGKVRQFAPGTRIMAAVKANGYGHGAVEVARALADADALAVATLAEALELRSAGVTQPIVLLGGMLDAEELTAVVTSNVQPVIHDFRQLRLIEQGDPGLKVSAWIKLDTGMHRLGFPPQAVPELRRRVAALRNVDLQGWMTHFASADETGNAATCEQIRSFDTALAGVEGARSLANSAAIIAWPAAHADWIRPGIMLYGASPLQGRTADDLGLRPVMSLYSRVLSIRELPAGETIGYGGTWITPEPMRIAILAAGYGDGYPRHAGNGTPILLKGRRVPLIGRVSMDLVAVDLRACDDAREGDEATLWGEGLPVDEVAAAAGTIAYALLCGVTQRVLFEYRRSA